jgi:hypothetical protein
MSMGATVDRPAPPAIAYSLAQRELHAEQHLLTASAAGFLDKTSCSRIAETYGVKHLISELKRMKGKMFPEFACNSEGGK